jgi:hypothetical protein
VSRVLGALSAKSLSDLWDLDLRIEEHIGTILVRVFKSKFYFLNFRMDVPPINEEELTSIYTWVTRSPV